MLENASLCFDGHFVTSRLVFGTILGALDLKGVPQSYLFDQNQHKKKKNKVQEGVLEKHDFGMGF